MTDPAPIADSIRARGFATVPGILSPDLASRLAEAISRGTADDARTYGADYIHRVGQEGFVIDLASRDDAFIELLEANPARPIVDALLGPDVWLYLFQGVVVPPGGGIGAYPWKWHCDLYHVATSVSDRDFLPGLNCLLYVDDVVAENGGTWLLPGSQGLVEGELPADLPRFVERHAFQVEARAGTALVFNPLLWHCAGANHTAAARRAVKMLYVRDWIIPQMDYARSVPPHVMARLSSPARALLGARRSVARTFSEAEALLSAPSEPPCE